LSGAAFEICIAEAGMPGTISVTDLLFGQLAVLNGFIDQGSLNQALSRQDSEREKSLAAILVELGTITEEERGLIERLCQRHRTRHGDRLPANSAAQSTATLAYYQPPVADTVLSSPDQTYAKQPARTFGDYELLVEIARGGMGVVYKARQNKLNRLVALKMIRSGELADAEQVKRFYAEAEAAAKLDHAGIVPIFEVGEADGQHFYSMAFVAGRSLNDCVKQDGPLPPRRAAELVRSVAGAVQFAHDKGIVHRDIKPQNVLLDEREQPRVTDFGLAKQVHTSSDLTIEGQVMGTPSYMPPEQAKGAVQVIGPASDVYSLGATLYFLLTGRPPFQTASAAETVRQVIEVEPVPPRRLNAAVPRDLETICLKCLRKESTNRYATAAALADDLGRWLEHKPIAARPVSRSVRVWLWCKRRPAVAAMIVALLFTVTLSGVAIDAQRARTARQRAQAHTEGMLTARPDGVPYALENLLPLGRLAVEPLRKAFDDPQAEPVRRLHAAYGLAALHEGPQNYLLDAIPTAPAAECRNIVAALKPYQAAVASELAQRTISAAESRVKARYAIVALHLGDFGPAKRVLAVEEDPLDRTTFIDSYSDWHADLTDVAASLQATDDSPLRSGLCAAIGSIAPDTLTPGERDALKSLFTEFYLHAPDGATHSAAGWALRNWNENLPPIEPADKVPGLRWMVNRQGMTLIELPAGKYFIGATLGVTKPGTTGEAHEATIERPFMLSDREVTIAQFQRFIDDADCPAADKPANWAGHWPHEGQTPDCPVQRVGLIGAILYCNWLSKQEGQPPCYLRSGEKMNIKVSDGTEMETDVWRLDGASDGYRLPTEEEWESACRSGSTRRYCFGDDDKLLGQYGWFGVNSWKRTWPVGSRLPNAWGFFDMHGNVWEWCWEGSWQEAPKGSCIRGGAWNRFSTDVVCSSRNGHAPADGDDVCGFRVAKNCP
jgi:formylglycine-generating enzyme required for sulfatase activity/tRNA A-37 threonylcarbamoyl transferase component Bud32